MNTHLRRIRWTGALLALCLLISGCRFLQTTEIGETRTETETVELGGADAASVRIEMPAGRLTVMGGADVLAQATFRTNAVGWDPRVDYRLNGDEGVLVVNQIGDDIPLGGELINEWDLQLSNAVPINLAIDTGAGEAELDLRGLDLSALQIQFGAGKTKLDLSSALDHDLRVTIDGGVGELSVSVPTDMGVQVSAETGIGQLTEAGLRRDGDTYVNEAFGEAAHTLYVDISSGIGAIKLVSE